jgi:hypothetical protein
MWRIMTLDAEAAMNICRKSAELARPLRPPEDDSRICQQHCGLIV